jgi:hypothetical protein
MIETMGIMAVLAEGFDMKTIVKITGLTEEMILQ